MPSASASPSRKSLLTTPLALRNAAYLSVQHIPDVLHLSPQFKTSQPKDIRQADLRLGSPVHAQGLENRRKAQTSQQGSGSGIGAGPVKQHHPIGGISAGFSLVHTISKPTWSSRSALMGPSRSCMIASTSTWPRRGNVSRSESHQGSSSQLRRARSRSTSTWGSSCPTTSPTAAAGTLKSLSTISWQGLCRPLRPEDSTAIRTRGACLRVLVSGQRVTLGWA